MVLTRLQDNTPAIYSSASRDFQLLERLYDAILNGTKYDIYSMLGVIDSVHCRSNLLPLLRLAVGFVSTAKYPDRVLRTMITAFPYLIRSKGTIGCVTKAAQIYLKAYGMSGDVVALYDPNNGTVELKIYSTPVDVVALSSFVKFFAPTGLKFSFVLSRHEVTPTITESNESGVIATIGNKYGSTVRSGKDKMGITSEKTGYVDKYISAVGSGVVSANSNEAGENYQEVEINGKK